MLNFLIIICKYVCVSITIFLTWLTLNQQCYVVNGTAIMHSSNNMEYEYDEYYHNDWNNKKGKMDKVSVRMPNGYKTPTRPYRDDATAISNEKRTKNKLPAVLLVNCIRRNGACDHWPDACCFNSSCRCTILGTNCRCERMGLFQKWG